MQTVYLKDGTTCRLVQKTEEGYLVEPLVKYQTGEDDWDEDYSGVYKMVPEVFQSAPTEIIESECQKIYDRISVLTEERDKLQKEKYDLQGDVNTLNRQKTDLTRLTFNRSDIKNAKRLVVFNSGKIAPLILDPSNRNKITLSIEISDYDPKIRAWTYKLYDEAHWSSSDSFDEKYGVLCDPTDEQIMEIHLKRMAEMKEISLWDLERTPDVWLTPELIKRKEEGATMKKKHERESKEKQLLEIKEWLENN